MKIAVRTPNWIGDVVMALPSIRALKRIYPDASLHLVSKSYLSDIFLNIPEVDCIIRIPDRTPLVSIFSSARKLRAMEFDMGILLPNSFHSALLFKLAWIKEIAGYNRDGRGFLLTHKIPVPPVYGHHREYYSHLVARLAGRDSLPDIPPELIVNGAETESAVRLLKSLDVPDTPLLMAIAPAAAYGTAKCWEADSYAGLIQRWKSLHPETQILIFGSARERKSIDRLVQQIQVPVFNLAGMLSLRQSITLLSRCQLAVVNDSGIMHLASALSLPLVAIFGPTLPQKTGPYSPRQRILFHPAECTPCSYRECPIHHPCMKSITVDEVIEACQQILEDETISGNGKA